MLVFCIQHTKSSGQNKFRPLYIVIDFFCQNDYNKNVLLFFVPCSLFPFYFFNGARSA